MRRRRKGDDGLSDDEVLARGYGEQAHAFDLTSGVPGGVPTGARWMARRMRTERFTLEEVVPSPSATVAEQAVAVLGQLGKLLDAPDEGTTTVIRGTFGVGFLDSTPVVVTVRVRPEADGSRVAVEGAAKQTVIRNKAAAQAARRVADALLRAG